MYNATVLRHYREPRNVGKIENTHGVGIYMNDFCGDITKVWTKVAEGKIVDAKYKTQGCAASIACGNDIISALNGLPEQKIHCSVPANDSLRVAIRDYLSRNSYLFPKSSSKDMRNHC
jgi:nitrogen fixation NifU-like protein